VLPFDNPYQLLFYKPEEIKSMVAHVEVGGMRQLSLVNKLA
jgi:hypothetical protein